MGYNVWAIKILRVWELTYRFSCDIKKKFFNAVFADLIYIADYVKDPVLFYLHDGFGIYLKFETKRRSLVFVW